MRLSRCLLLFALAFALAFALCLLINWLFFPKHYVEIWLHGGA